MLVDRPRGGFFFDGVLNILYLARSEINISSVLYRVVQKKKGELAEFAFFFRSVFLVQKRWITVRFWYNLVQMLHFAAFQRSANR